MIACLLALALTIGGGEAPPDSIPPVQVAPAAQTTVPADRWIAEDKLRHFALSFAATDMVYAGATVGADRHTALYAAATTALALGLAKEVRDRRAGQHFCLKDLVWDAAGVTLGVLLVRNIR